MAEERRVVGSRRSEGSERNSLQAYEDVCSEEGLDLFKVLLVEPSKTGGLLERVRWGRGREDGTHHTILSVVTYDAREVRTAQVVHHLKDETFVAQQWSQEDVDGVDQTPCLQLKPRGNG